MSGYDPQTGIYTLTQQKAQEYHHSSNEDTPQPEAMTYYAQILKKAGFKVISVHQDCLKVKASQVQIWQTLSSENSVIEILTNPSNPE